MRHQNGTWETVATQGSCTARHEAAMVAVKGRLYLLGGRGIKPVDEFDPKTSTWRPLARPPLELHHFQAVALKDRIAIVGAMTGGYPHETPIPNIWFFDPAKNE
ncbi:hypothetical protein, partial [Armatimonas sp.]|uniref:Kelch repeat-containing protein n=1 Tax=Armatimonas sp. TaxID=1872638 RepID=UPI00286B43AC